MRTDFIYSITVLLSPQSQTQVKYTDWINPSASTCQLKKLPRLEVIIRIRHVCLHQDHLFTVYVLGKLKELLHCSQGAKQICVQIFFQVANSQFKYLGCFCAQSGMSCSSTNGSSECQVSGTKATSHSSLFCLKLTLLPPLYS